MIKGQLLIRFRDGEVRVGTGEFVVIPRGIDHLPIAAGKVHVLLIEPKTTLSTGNVRGDRKVVNPEWI